MRYHDIFHTIVHETNFLFHFFHEQYVIDLEEDCVFDMQLETTTPLPIFLSQKEMILPPQIDNGVLYLDNNYLLLSAIDHPYLCLLRFRTNDFYLQDKPQFFPAKTHIPTLATESYLPAIKKHSTLPTYILIFDFLTNQDLENPNTKEYIENSIISCLQDHFCYFKQVRYNLFYILIKDIPEMDIYAKCKEIKMALNNKKKRIYLAPQFLLSEYPPSVNLDTFLITITNAFHSLVFKDKEFIVHKNMVTK